MRNSARFVKAHAMSTGKLGVTGFCWGGGTTNFLAVTLGGDLQALGPGHGAEYGGRHLLVQDLDIAGIDRHLLKDIISFAGFRSSLKVVDGDPSTLPVYTGATMSADS